MSDDPGEPARDPSAAGSTAITKTRRTWRVPVEAEAERPDFAVVRRLILGSALMLFLELALIRWLGSNVVHLSYFSNFVLLGSFLGIGLGFLIAAATLVGAARRPGDPRRAGDRHLPGPGDHRPGRRPDHLLHLAEHERSAGLAGAAADLRPGRGRAGRPGGGRRPVLRPSAPADRLPLGPGRVADRHRLVHPACRSCGRRRWCGASSSPSVFVAADRQLAAVPGAPCAGPGDGRRRC